MRAREFSSRVVAAAITFVVKLNYSTLELLATPLEPE